MPTIGEWIQIGTLLSVFVGVYVSWRNNGKITEVSVQMDGRMEQLLNLTRSSSHAEGVEQERVREK